MPIPSYVVDLPLFYRDIIVPQVIVTTSDGFDVVLPWYAVEQNETARLDIDGLVDEEGNFPLTLEELRSHKTLNGSNWYETYYASLVFVGDRSELPLSTDTGSEGPPGPEGPQGPAGADGTIIPPGTERQVVGYNSSGAPVAMTLGWAQFSDASTRPPFDASVLTFRYDSEAEGEWFNFTQLAAAAVANTVPLRGVDGVLKVGDGVAVGDAVNLGQMIDAFQEVENLALVSAAQSAHKIYPPLDTGVDISVNLPVNSINSLLRIHSTEHTDPITLNILADSNYSSLINYVGNVTALEFTATQWGSNTITVAAGPGVTLLKTATAEVTTQEAYASIRVIRVDVDTWMIATYI